MSSAFPDQDPRLAREMEFHDRLALELDADAMEASEPAELEEALFSVACVRGGDRVLDLGCGAGDLTLQLLDRDARVTALDLSPGMIDVARRRVARLRPEAGVEWVAAPFAAAALGGARFDVVVGRYVLHHLASADAAADLRAVLAPGGRAVFVENWSRNPVLRLARRHVAGRFGVTRLGTEDEEPLGEADLEAYRARFPGLQLHHPVFEFLRIFDRQVLRYRSERASAVLHRVDAAAGRVPALAPYSYRVLVELPA